MIATCALLLGAVGTASAGIIAEEHSRVTISLESITGTVTEEGTGAPIAGVTVSIAGTSSGSTTTDASGQYEFRDLSAGTYSVNFYKVYYETEWYDNSDAWITKTDVVYNGTTTRTGIDGSLSRTPVSISGTVTDFDTSNPVSGLRVTAYNWTGSIWASTETTYTDASGGYGLVILNGAGTYRVGFNTDATDRNPWYQGQYYEQVTDIEDGTDVVFDGSTTVTGIYAPLRPIPDTEPPVVQDDVAGPYDDEAVISIEATDTETDHAVSGVASISYSLNGETTQTVPGGAAEVRAGFGPSWQTLKYYATDNDGNKSGVVPRSFRVDDATPPATTDDVQPTYTSSATITINATDTASGVLHIEYVLDSEATETVTAEQALVSAGVGSHTLTYWAADNIGHHSAPVTRNFTVYAAAAGPVVPQRVADNDRFSTAVKIAREGWGGGGSDWTGVTDIVIASGDDRAAADPLSAAGLCWAYDAPLFLVSANFTPSQVKAAVKEIADDNGNVTVHIVGGPVSVPDARYNDLESHVGGGRLSKDRLLSTGGRFDMAAKIAREMKRLQGTPDTVLIANGADATKFFDALALSPIAANKGYPILLVNATSVPSATNSVVNEFSPSTVIVGGGPNTVSDSVKNQLGAVRWSDKDRYSTATKVASNAIAANYLDATVVGVAAKLPDALTGGSMVGSMGGPLVITNGESLTAVTGNWLSSNKSDIAECFVFGGEKSMTPTVKNQIEDKLK
jgi:putative cell wall-binding protein/5-hydroxyisourate hydrolase-like protein (transthyretin family)